MLLRGRVEVLFYSDSGEIIERYLLVPHKGEYGLYVPKGRWHTLEAISESAVFEVNKGLFISLFDDDILKMDTLNTRVCSSLCHPEKRQNLTRCAT